MVVVDGSVEDVERKIVILRIFVIVVTVLGQGLLECLILWKEVEK